MPQPDCRTWHYLKQVRGSHYPRRWVLVDCVSSQYQSDTASREILEGLRCCAVQTLCFSGGTWGQYEPEFAHDPASAQQLLWSQCSRAAPTWIIGWRVSRTLEIIDWWREIERGHFGPRGVRQEEEVEIAAGYHQAGDVARVLVTADPPTIVSGWWHDKSLTIVDSRNYWSEDVEGLAREQGTALPTAPENGLVDAALHGYLSHRLAVLCRQLQTSIDHWRAITGASWATTAAGCAWTAWRKIGMPARSILIHGDTDALALERAGYYGGLCAPSYVGVVSTPEAAPSCPASLGGLPWLYRQGGVVHLDVCSQYPTILHQYNHPVRLNGVRQGDRRLESLLSGQLTWGAAFVRVRTDEPCYPCRVHAGTQKPLLGPRWNLDRRILALPTRTIFPVGEFDTVLCGGELEHALLHSRLVRVYCWAEHATGRVDSGFVAALQEIRQQLQREGLDVASAWIKRCLNSLVGRFGQLCRDWQPQPTEGWEPAYGAWHSIDVDTREIEHWRSIAGHVARQVAAGETENSCPAIAASVAERGRAQLHRGRASYPAGSVYYSDTDSLWVDGLAFQTHTLPGALVGPGPGNWRVVGASAAMVLLGIRTYWTPLGWVVSGVHQASDNARDGEWRVVHQDTAGSILARGAGTGYRIRSGRRQWKVTDVGGRITESGWIEPWEVKPALR